MIRPALCLILLLTIIPWHMAYAQKYAAIKDLPVLHEGRIKPFDSAARNILRFLSNDDSVGKMDATEWLTHAMFDPAFAVNSPVIAIDSQREVDLLGLPKAEQRIYSAFSITLARLQNDTPDSPLPLSDTLKTRLALIHQISNSLTPFLTLQIDAYEGETLVSLLMSSNGTIPDPVINDLINQGRNNILLRLIPSRGHPDLMLSPWQIVNGEALDPHVQQAVELWQQASRQWQASDMQGWANSVIAIKRMSYTRTDAHPMHGAFEVILNRLNPVTIGLAACLLAALFAAAPMAGVKKWPSFYINAALLTLCTALLVAVVKMISRIIILGRPPVGTLYESILFVIVIILALGLYWCWRKRTAIMLFSTAIMASILYLLAMSNDSQGDNMMVLGAVLNSDFWLLIHVLVITAGYGVCLLCGLYAFLLLLKPKTEGALLSHPLYPLMIRSALIALALTATGTVLGGIWADQSWGRFWGWDPKENGAMLIVLWLAWALHARLSGFINGPYLLSIFTLLWSCVALSWFGVNLLGVGLHSYGFTEGAFSVLMAFIALQILSIIWLVWRWKGQKNG